MEILNPHDSVSSSRLGIPYIAQFQADKEATHNAGLGYLDEYVGCSVLEVGLGTPPVAPNIGDAYVVGAGATGDWTGFDDYYTVWDGYDWAGIWSFTGMLTFNLDDLKFYWYTGAAWEQADEANFFSCSDVFTTYALRGGELLRVNLGETGIDTVEYKGDSTLTLTGSPLEVTPTLNTGVFNESYVVTLSDDTLVINDPAGTPSNFQRFKLLVDASVGFDLFFGVGYRGSALLSLPTTLAAGQWYFVFIYNDQDSCWDMLSYM